MQTYIDPNIDGDPEDHILVFLCGVHGVGKSSIAKLLPDLFSDIDVEAYYIREMNRKPNLKAGTPSFQKWYAKRMEWRNNTIAGQLNPNAMSSRPEVLILDRIKQDVDVYSNIDRWNDMEYITELAHNLVYELRWWADYYRDDDRHNIHIYCYLIYREINDVMRSLFLRMAEAGEGQRIGWDETNRENWKKLDTLFREVWTKAQYIVENMQQYSHDNIYIIMQKNNDIEQSAKSIVDEVRLVW